LLANDQEMLEPIRQVESPEFEKLFRKYYSELCSYLRIFIKDKDDIEEIVQEVFLNIWEQRCDFYSKENIRAYLYKAVKNRAINYHKHLAVRLKTVEDIKLLFMHKYDDVEKNFDGEELLQVLDKAVQTLPKRCKEVFVLTKINELSYKETAEIMGISIKTVEIQLSIAVKKLRKLLKPYL